VIAGAGSEDGVLESLLAGKGGGAPVAPVKQRQELRPDIQAMGLRGMVQILPALPNMSIFVPDPFPSRRFAAAVALQPTCQGRVLEAGQLRKSGSRHPAAFKLDQDGAALFLGRTHPAFAVHGDRHILHRGRRNLSR
jgi:hypothetical protein